MKRILVALFAVALATSAYADGAATYAAKCKMCHGADAKGGAMFKTAIAGMAKDTVKKTILEGKGKMKPVKVSDAEAAEVAGYVAGLK